jgi:hypothetical protein
MLHPSPASASADAAAASRPSPASGVRGAKDTELVSTHPVGGS